MQAAEYEQAYRTFVGRLLRAEFAADSFLGLFAVHTNRHEGRNRTIISGEPVEWPGITSTMEGSLNVEDARRGRIPSHDATMRALAKQHLQTMASATLSHLSRVIDHTGQSVDGEGRPLDYDHILDLLEMRPWKFNEDGSVNRENEVFIIPPEWEERARLLAVTEPTEEQRLRKEKMRDRKYAEWLLARRTRRIPNYGKAP